MCSMAEKEDGGLGNTVASHYNQLEEVGIEKRKESRIFHMRNFNNWAKSTLINEFVGKVKAKRGRDPITVLDLGSGKGGDLKKWNAARVHKVILADIAATSVQQSEERYRQMKEKNPRLFRAEFIAADCTKERLYDKYSDKDTLIDIVSCQFAFHYSFETLEQADMMLRNAGERLRPGGFFIGTTPDARELVRRLKDSDSLMFGNDIYSVTFDSKDDFPLFGCKYDFHLEGVVDCPEFLVHYGVLMKLASKYGLTPVYKENFAKLVSQKMKDQRNVDLLRRMSALEEYPAAPGKQLSSPNPSSYLEAEAKLKELKEAEPDRRHRVLTLSKEEWEAVTVYLAFAFLKTGPTKEDSKENEMLESVRSRKRKHSEDSDSDDGGPDAKAPPTVPS